LPGRGFDSLRAGRIEACAEPPVPWLPVQGVGGWQ